jgi:hypothetical protein
MAKEPKIRNRLGLVLLKEKKTWRLMELGLLTGSKRSIVRKK